MCLKTALANEEQHSNRQRAGTWLQKHIPKTSETMKVAAPLSSHWGDTHLKTAKSWSDLKTALPCHFEGLKVLS